MAFYDFGISSEVLTFAKETEEGLAERFAAIDAAAERNQYKVIAAMRDARVSEDCLLGTTGYGYNDRGREVLESVYARVFHTEDALVRPLIACGTHALSIALAGNLRPGDELLSVSGRPYDTLEKVIGIRPSPGSLAEYGVTYRQVDLLPDGTFDLDAIRLAIGPKTRVVAIQRSRGYQVRPSLRIREIERAIQCVRAVKKDAVILVDNCYGEFVEDLEPGDIGADLVVGSLIKNPGGGLAPIGGYIAGTRECVGNAAIRLTAPGLGKEVGATLSVNRSFFQGLFLAPVVTAAALKGAVFAAAAYERLGFPADPGPDAFRTDIIQSVTLGSPERVLAFAKGIQNASPVDSFVTPEADDMPGYEDPVVMAAGTFISGASIELSADAPLRPPFAIYFQGGLTYPSAKLGILMTIENLRKEGLLPEGRL